MPYRSSRKKPSTGWQATGTEHIYPLRAIDSNPPSNRKVKSYEESKWEVTVLPFWGILWVKNSAQTLSTMYQGIMNPI